MTWAARPLREVVNQVRACNDDFDGPGTICLQLIDGNEFAEVGHVGGGWTELGREDLPGDGRPCDAVAIARRLLAAFRDEQARWTVYQVDKNGRRKRFNKNWC